MKARYHVERIVRWVREFFEDQWFDRTRHVRTSGDTPLPRAGIAPAEIQDSELYVPARPAHIREALRAMPVRDVSGFTCIDLGSGKGRTLFVAAELPFRRILGVEFSRLLHERASANIRRFRFRGRRYGPIESLHMNAKDFAFPEGKLVLYMFNPFGRATMQAVLAHLAESLARDPRHVVVILLWPRCGDMVAAIDGMRLCGRTQRYEIFEAHAPQPEYAHGA